MENKYKMIIQKGCNRLRLKLRNKVYKSFYPNRFQFKFKTEAFPGKVNFYSYPEQIIQYQDHKKSVRGLRYLSLTDTKCFGSMGLPLRSNKWQSWALTTANYKKSHRHIPFVDFYRYHQNIYKTEKINIPVLLPPLAWAGSFYHWIVECLPAIIFGMLLRKTKSYSQLRIALPSQLNDFQRHSLLLIGLDPKNELILAHNRYFETSELIIPIDIRRKSANIPFSFPDPYLLKLLKKQIRNKIKPDEELNGDFVWISRRNSGSRQIIEENKLIRELNDKGYKINLVIPENLNLEEQIKMVNTGKVIIGPHGAGLTNILWSNAQEMREITGPKIINPSFSSLCLSLGIKHSFIKTRQKGKFLKNRGPIIMEVNDII